MNVRVAGLCAAAALALSACATTGDVMQRAPAAQFMSSKPATQVSGCIAPRMLRVWNETKVSPDGAGTLIAVSGSAWGNPVAVIDVQPSTNGSRISLRRGIVSDHVFAGIARDAQSCR